MRRLVLTCLLLLLSIVTTNPVHACGGGAPFAVQFLEDHDFIVHATVLEVDERGYNAILQVDRYFKGHGGEHLAVMRYPPALEVVAAVRGYDTLCLYSGGGQEWIVGSEGYFALSNNGDGTYVDVFSSYGGAPHFFVQDGMVEFYNYDVTTAGSFQLRSLPVDEFETLLLDYGGIDAPIEPTENAYPLMRFLTVTTESGGQYLLNPDRSVTHLDPENAPLAVSNDGSHVVFRHDDEQLAFQYLSLVRLPFFEDRGTGSRWSIPQPGRSASFSPNSNFVAVWEATQLTIYMFDNYEVGGYGQHMRMQVVASADVEWALNESTPPTAWSSDSTTIAYQDERGIWLMDIFEQSEPQLIVPQDDTFTLLDISASGRYVRYGQPETWTLLDVRTGDTFENAIATPDERNFIYLQPEFPEGTPDVDRRDDRECTAPLSNSCPIYLRGRWTSRFDFFWYTHDQIALIDCSDEACYIRSHHWQLSIASTSYDRRLDTILPLISAIDYDILYDQWVVVMNDYTLDFGLYTSWDRDEARNPPIDIDSVDLRDQLDSPIVRLEWGQPIFYDHRNYR